MKDATRNSGVDQQTGEVKSVLDEVLREGARKMLQATIEAEVAEYMEKHTDMLDEQGHRVVVRNGHLPERELVTGVGPIPVRQPRINDKRPGQKYTSKILPPFMRRAPSIDALIPGLYLKGISTGDFTEALT